MTNLNAACQRLERDPGPAFNPPDSRTVTRAPGSAYSADAKGESWTDASGDLAGGKLKADYFKDGNTIMTAVHLGYPAGGTLDHWVVIVKESTTITVGSTKHHLYPADDPLSGRVMVLAPKIGRVGEDALKKAQSQMEQALKTF